MPFDLIVDFGFCISNISILDRSLNIVNNQVLGNFRT